MSAIRLSFFKSVHFYYIHSLGGASPGLNIPGRSNNLGSHTFEGIICKTIAIDSLGMSCGVSLEEELRYYGGKNPKYLQLYLFYFCPGGEDTHIHFSVKKQKQKTLGDWITSSRPQSMARTKSVL